MTVFVLENLATLPTLARNLRNLLTRLARALDALVSARAARAVPEWQMQEVQSQISRYCNIIQTADPPTQCSIEPSLRCPMAKIGHFRAR